MSDNSHLDNKYFIDEKVFNCPFCKRNNAIYHVIGNENFDWNKDKKCYIYLTQCSSCVKTSMHLTFTKIELVHKYQGIYLFKKPEDFELDSLFFYSVPTSFFALDSRIPKKLRELFIEAEGCLKSNYLTGSSVCIRKIIYELAILESAEGENYDERIKSLKIKRTDVEPEYFDTLLTIQQLTSDKVHEESYDGWENKHIKMLLSTLGEILTLMYVIPEIRKEKRIAVLELKKELENGQTQKKL